MRGNVKKYRTMSNKKFEYLIKEACWEACEREMSALSLGTDDLQVQNITFSKGFENDMDNLIADIRSGRFQHIYGKKAEVHAAARTTTDRKHPYQLHIYRKLKLIAIAAAMLFLLCACAAAYIAIEMYIHPDEDHTDITFGNGSLSTGADTAQRFQILKPDIPEGYEITYENLDSNGHYTLEINNKENNTSIGYTQYVPGNSSAAINTEFSGHDKIMINGRKGIRYEPPESTGYLWSDDSYVYIISGNCDEKLLLHMAESVNKKH